MLASFLAAGKGFLSSIKEGRNLRFHLSAACFVLYWKQYYSLSKGEEALLFLAIGSVIASELLNTAVEHTVDLCCPRWDPLAGKAKDAAAGAVLVSAVFAAAAGICLFWDTDILLGILHSFLQNPQKIVLLCAALCAAVWFIFFFDRTVRKIREVKH